MVDKPEFPIITYCDLEQKVKVEYNEKDFTCSRCKIVSSCDYAWNLYNTNNDCLASK